eukprot:3642827-Rhodomonas_salina.1
MNRSVCGGLLDRIGHGLSHPIPSDRKHTKDESEQTAAKRGAARRARACSCARDASMRERCWEMLAMVCASTLAVGHGGLGVSPGFVGI